MAAAQQSGVRVGNATLYPTLGLSVGYDNNVALSAGETEKQESAFVVVSPGVRLETGTRRSTFRLDLTADIGEYEGTERDDYIDYGANASWIYDPTIRSTLGLEARWRKGHDRRGGGLQDFIRSGFIVERDVDKYTARDVDVFYEYGADGARGRLELTAGYGDVHYDNNREFTRVGDYDVFRYGGSLGWRVAPKTSALFIARFTEADYDFSDRDHDTRFYGVGVEWDATAKTSGRLEFGHREADYDNGESYSGSSWIASVEWRPREHSTVELSTGRTTDTAFGDSTYVLRESYEMSWRHQWKPKWGSVVDLGFADEMLRPSNRDDDVLSYGASLNYDFRRWLQLGIGYKYYDRDSSDPAYDYDQGQVIFSTELSF